MSLFYKGKEVKYIISDLDGTLVFNEDSKCDEETYDLIEQCINHGVLFIIASGRPYENEYLVMNRLQDKVSYIGDNGAVCMHKGEMVACKKFKKEDTDKIFNIAKNMEHCELLASTKNGVYTDSKDPVFLNQLKNVIKIHTLEIDNMFDIDVPIFKISSWDINGVKRMLQDFKEANLNLIVATSGNVWLDFLDPTTNKGTGLESLLEVVGIDPKDGIAFGDQENDIAMLQTAGIGFCMKTGAEKARESADIIMDSPKDIMKEMLQNEA